MRQGEDTIVAVATPPGVGAIGIVRLTGPDAISIAERVFRRSHGQDDDLANVASHTVNHGYIADPESDEPIDEVLLLVMRGPHSYTGEDVVECHGHGGPVPLSAVLRALLQMGARPAEPGEFTRRAFLNGRLDLSQAEAVADLIDSRSQKGAQLALDQLAGRLGAVIRGLRHQLLDMMAHLEVVLDYPEMAIEPEARERFREQLVSIRDELDALIRSASTGKPFRDGVRTVILGQPNVGKSSLLNAMLGRDRAIVTEIPGTTRDVLEESVVVNGLPLVLTDTAGLRSSEDEVERIGVDRATAAAQQADLILFVLDDTQPLSEEEVRLARELAEQQGVILVVNKIDLGVGAIEEKMLREYLPFAPIVRVSAKTRSGLETLDEAVSSRILGDSRYQMGGEGVIITNARHEQALRRAREALDEGMTALDGDMPADMVSIDLRETLEALGQITGDTVTEDLLDRIFSTFCLGK